MNECKEHDWFTIPLGDVKECRECGEVYNQPERSKREDADRCIKCGKTYWDAPPGYICMRCGTLNTMET